MEPIKSRASSEARRDIYILANAMVSGHSSRDATRSSSVDRQLEPNKTQSSHKNGHQSPLKTGSSANMNLDANKHRPSLTNTHKNSEEKDTEISHHHNSPDESSPTALDTANMTNPHVGRVHDAGSISTVERHRLRSNIPEWKWKTVLLANGFLSLVHGYDVGNIANLQPAIYQAFGSIVALPWLALGYAVSIIAFIPLGHKLLRIVDFKILSLLFTLVMMMGAAISGSAHHFVLVIFGRMCTAWGASVIYQGILSHNLILCSPYECLIVTGYMAGCFAAGLVVGPVIGGVFAGTEQITWRWAFYLMIPLCGISFILQAFCLPRYCILNEKFGPRSVRGFDCFGIFLHIVVCFSFSFSCMFLGSARIWGAGWALASWAIFVLFAFTYAVQQAYSIGTTPNERIVSPFSLFTNRTVLLNWICTTCAATAYGAALYYVPIYFAFHEGLSPLDAATRLLPLVCIFVFAIILSGALLPGYRIYKIFFMIGSMFLLIGGGLFQTLTDETPESSMMAFEALVAVGIGMLWHLATTVGFTIIETTKERLDLALLSNVAKFGGIAVSLSLAGVIFMDTGFQSLKESLSNGDAKSSFSDEQIFELLAGVNSPILISGNSTTVKPMVMSAITDGIKGCFAIIIAAGGLSFLAALCMKWEAMGSDEEVKSGGPEPDSHSGQKSDGEIILDGLTVTGEAIDNGQASHSSVDEDDQS
ncbi:MFS general substrate transporter [Annulohypoxylon maeteangense]|uniref:MFS general substrate transporter n=1 Tax=Annulohypoxylon maeteangense TaxID=1927788 RepID=UPI002008DB02|nr:MFS general substrate transporter [Annulohypoxylon maeteangense]KAI0885486.1 MFS general substrate transporter [Annulohypoxylon maeteangense]